MGVRLSVSGLLLAADFRAETNGGTGPGFFSASILPDGSREPLDVWAFGDSTAAHLLASMFEDHGRCDVTVVAEVRAKLNKEGNRAILSSALLSAVDAEGVEWSGRVAAPAA